MPGLSPIRATIAAGERRVISARGSLVFLRRVLTAPPASFGGAGVDANLDIKVTAEVRDTGERYEVNMGASEKLRPAAEYYRVEIENPQAISLWIELYLGVGDFVRPVPDIVNVSLASASSTLTQADDKINIDAANAGKELLSAANTQRLRIMITALSTNANAIRIGGADVDTDNGIPLQAGESIALQTQAAVYACSEAAVDQGAAVLEETT